MKNADEGDLSILVGELEKDISSLEALSTEKNRAEARIRAVGAFRRRHEIFMPKIRAMADMGAK